MRIINLSNTNRIELIPHLKNFSRGNKCVEIGVWRGDFSNVLYESNIWEEIYGVDPYVLYEGYTDRPGKEFRAGQERLDKLFAKVNQSFTEKGMTLFREMSIEASKRFDDNSLDFVYIDGNHRYEAVIEDINSWWHKTSNILAGDDYSETNKINDEPFGVINAVNEFSYRNNLNLFLTNDSLPSWLVFKDKLNERKFTEYTEKFNL